MHPRGASLANRAKRQTKDGWTFYSPIAFGKQAGSEVMKRDQPAVNVAAFTYSNQYSCKWFYPDLGASHPLGEISALAAVGSLSFESGLKLISRVAALMQCIYDWVYNT